MNVNDLLTRTQQGHRLTALELDFVRTALSDSNTAEDTYTLIHILWKARDTEATSLFWKHTRHPDEMVRRIALQALVRLSATNEVLRLAMDMTTDPSVYVRMVAATAVGTIASLRPERASEAAELLLDGFARLQSGGGVEWESYYEGLLELTSAPQGARPLATKDVQMRDVNPAVIEAARRLIHPE
jgi:hypothetical protein